MSSYSIYNKIHTTSSARLEVSKDKFALISEANIQRYETLEVYSGSGTQTYPIIVAVSNDKYFQPVNSSISYTLQQGLNELNKLIADQEVSPLDKIRAEYKLGAAFVG